MSTYRPHELDRSVCAASLILEISPRAPTEAYEPQRKDLARWAADHGVEWITHHAERPLAPDVGFYYRMALHGALELLAEGQASKLVVHPRAPFPTDPMMIAMVEHLAARHGGEVSYMGEAPRCDRASIDAMRTVLGEYDDLAHFLGVRSTRSIRVLDQGKRVRYGAVPFGYRLHSDGKTLVEDQEEQEALALIGLLRVQGKSYAKIAKELTDRGFKSRGKRWYETTIVRLLERPRGWRPEHGSLSKKPKK